MALDTMTIVSVLVSIVINVVVQSLFVWLAGRAFVGAEKGEVH